MFNHAPAHTHYSEHVHAHVDRVWYIHGMEKGTENGIGFPDLRTRDEVQQYLRGVAETLGVSESDNAVAEELDRRDTLAHFRGCFHIPSVGQLLSEQERSPSTS